MRETFDFDKVTDRSGTNSMKWNVRAGELPMWVADMDFPTAPAVRRAIEQRAAHGVFGYSEIPDEWADAYLRWWKTRHGFIMKREWLVFTTGVVAAISSMVRRLTQPNENVLLLTPVYNIFYNSIINNGCRPLECELVLQEGRYHVDWRILEEGLADPQTSLMILCNPQNPCGFVWKKEELRRIGNLAAKYHVTVISDEVHCDFTRPKEAYVPFASVSEENARVSITCLSPSKSFNVAGLNTAAVVVPDPFLRHKVERGLNTDEIAEPGVFAVQTAIAAYEEGGEWFDALNEYLFDNKDLLEKTLKVETPFVHVIEQDATYLCWIDCRDLVRRVLGEEALTPEKAGTSARGSGSRAAIPGQQPSVLASFIREKTGLYVSHGEEYGRGGEGFLRVNMACPRSVARDGISRLVKGLTLFRDSCP